MVPQPEVSLNDPFAVIAPVTVFVEGLEFYAFHGVPAEERAIGHRYVLDIWMEVPPTATQTDRVEDSADYGQLSLRITQLAQAKQFKTVERLGQVIIEDIASTYSTVSAIRLRLAKRLPPAPVIVATAGVELNWRRKVN